LPRASAMVCPSSSSRREWQGRGAVLHLTNTRRFHLCTTRPAPDTHGSCTCLLVSTGRCLIDMRHTMCRLFKGITPLWGRQIPYTMMKFGELSKLYGISAIATRLIRSCKAIALPYQLSQDALICCSRPLPTIFCNADCDKG
jgi:hypothetical protein